MVNLANYLNVKTVKFLEVNSRDQAIAELVQALGEAGYLEDEEAFSQAILEREKIVSTGIGMGVAIPHAKLPSFNNFFIAVGLFPNEGVDWQALDESPVHLIFMVGGPDDKQTQYLQILSTITVTLKDEEARRRILRMETPEEIIEFFSHI